MATIGKMRKKYVKGQFEKMAKGELVSDDEKAGWQRQMQSAAEQGLGAQQQALARTSQALAGGGPVAAGAIARGTQNLGAAGGDLAVKASGQANQLAAAVREKRAAQALGAGERLIQSNKEDAALAIETGLRVAETIGELIPGA
jgi:hypothetical protein